MWKTQTNNDISVFRGTENIRWLKKGCIFYFYSGRVEGDAWETLGNTAIAKMQVHATILSLDTYLYKCMIICAPFKLIESLDKRESGISVKAHSSP